MAKLSKSSVPIMEGTALLVKIANSPTWHVKYKASGKWRRTSTKQRDLAKAKKSAVDIVLEARFKERNDIPIVNQSFRIVANAAIRRMERQIESGSGKTIYEDYIYILRRYHIPYFSGRYITSLDHTSLAAFDAWRTNEAGKQLAKSTITNHNSALNRVFDEAVLLNYLTRSKVPELQNKGLSGQRRPDFSIEAYTKLHRAMRYWVKEKTRKEQSSQIRYLLRDLVLILANTGMRWGTETANLHWTHITIRKQNGNEYLSLHVNGKTGPRDLIARQRCRGWFERILFRADDLPYSTLEEVIKARVDKPVFRLADGTIPARLDQTFKRLLTGTDLLICPNSGKARTLYSLRHSYASWALEKEIPIHTVAVQMGTSVQMLEKHYSHLTAFKARDALSGIK